LQARILPAVTLKEAMQRDDFEQVMERLRNQWPGFYKAERIRLIYMDVGYMEKSRFSDIVDYFLSESRTPPTPKEIGIRCWKVREQERAQESHDDSNTFNDLINHDSKVIRFRARCVMKILQGTITSDEREEFDLSTAPPPDWVTEDV